MPTPIDVMYERTFNGTARRIYELLTELGTSQDRIWPFASQPFIRSPGPLTPGTTEEWHGGLHAVLADGTHGFSLDVDGRKVTVRHRLTATLDDVQGRLLWRRLEEQHERAIEGLFDKLARVLKR